MDRKRVQLLVLCTFVVAVTNGAESASTTTTDPVTLPPPKPSVTEFNYLVRDPETGVPCILANMSISITARYASTDGDMKTTVLNIPPTVKVEGKCRGPNPTMGLIWFEDPTLEETLNGIVFSFGSTGNTSFLEDVVYALYVGNETFPDAKNQGGDFAGYLNNVYKFVGSKNDGLYKCAPETTVYNEKIAITITNVALITFNTENSVATRTEENCEFQGELDPSVTEFNYYVGDRETGVACILANMSISIKANYLSTSHKPYIKTAFLKIPSTAEVRGTCRGTTPTMELFWAEDPTLVGTQNRIAFTFGSTGDVSYLQDIVYELYMDNKTFPEADDEGGRFRDTLKNVYKFVASKNDGLYTCALETTVGSVEIDITITDVALIAFNTEKSVATKTVEHCEPESGPTPAPLPPPDPSVTEFNYYVRDPETGVACILANMSISIKANYISTSYDTKTAFLKIPPTAEVRGTCRGIVPTMELIWTEDPTLEGTHNEIALMFNSTDSKFFLQDIVLELCIHGKNFPDAKQEGRRFGTELQKINKFSASKNGGLYKCESETTMGTKDIEITIANVALIAFNTEESVATRIEEHCVSGADVAQWSGYLLLTAKILIFLKLGH